MGLKRSEHPRHCRLLIAAKAFNGKGEGIGVSAVLLFLALAGVFQTHTTYQNRLALVQLCCFEKPGLLSHDSTKHIGLVSGAHRFRGDILEMQGTSTISNASAGSQSILIVDHRSFVNIA